MPATAYAAACRVTCAPQRDHRSTAASAPGPACCRLPAPQPEQQPACPEAMTGQPEQGRQQGDRRQHHHEHHRRDAHTSRGDEREPGEGQPEDRHHDGAAGEDDGLPGGRQGAAHRLRDRDARGEVLPVAREEEQGVVDAHAQPDHGRHDRRPDRDVDEQSEQRDQTGAHQQPEQRHRQRQPGGQQRPEGHHQDHRRDHQAEHLAHVGGRLLEAEVEVTARFEPQRRRRPRLRQDGLERGQVGDGELADLGVLHPHQCHPAVRGHLLGRAQHLRQVTHGRLQPVQVDPGLPGVHEGFTVLARCRHDVCRQPACAAVGARQQVGGGLGVGPGRRHRVVQLLPEAGRGGDDQDREEHPGSDGDPGAGGRPASPAVQQP